MSFVGMAWRYLRFRWLVSLLTVIGIGLGVALVCAVLALRHESERALSRDAGLYDLVVGGKGSPLQLVLSSVYHLDSPTGNLPYSDFERLGATPVLWVAPVGLGDNFRAIVSLVRNRNFSIFGPQWESFFTFAKGKVFENRFGVVLEVKLQLQRGSVWEILFRDSWTCRSSGAEVHRDFPYRVSGILAPTATAQDRAIFGTLESVWEIHETEDRLHSAIQGSALLEGHRAEASAILIRLKTPGCVFGWG